MSRRDDIVQAGSGGPDFTPKEWPMTHETPPQPEPRHESNHHGWGGPCDGCAPCPIHGDNCPKAAARLTRSSEARTYADPKYVEFTERAASEMERRLEHGRAKWGVDWDEEPYDDERNEERIRRAVDHLIAARANTPDPAEWQKRAADVANQAFMYADPNRVRSSEARTEPEAER